MPIYHFQTFHGLEYDEDSTGVDLENDEVARKMAVRFAGECIKDMGKEIFSNHVWAMRVTNADDKPILHLSFRVAEQ